MTIAFDRGNTMKLLAKVARGLDLPLPAESSPPPVVPLAQEATVIDEQLDMAEESTPMVDDGADIEHDQVVTAPADTPPGNDHPFNLPVSDRNTAPTSGRPTVSPDLPSPATTIPLTAESARVSSPSATGPRAYSSPPEPIPADIRSGTRSDPATAIAEPAKASDTSAYAGAEHSEIATSGSIQIGSPAVTAGSKESVPGEPAQTPPQPDHQPADNKGAATGEKAGTRDARWQTYRAGKPQRKASRGNSGMLRAVFDNPDLTGAAKPADIQKMGPTSSRKQVPATNRHQDPTAAPATIPGIQSATPLPQNQPATGPSHRKQSGNQQAGSYSNGPAPAATRSAKATHQPPVAPNRRHSNHRTNTYVHSAGQFVPGAEPPKSAAGRPAVDFTSQESPGGNAGGVSVGRINIQVRSQRQTEDDWPAPPQYTSHSITSDWEWSCHYGK